MDLKEIRSLAKLMKEMDLSAVEISEKDKTVRIERQAALAAASAPPAAIPGGELPASSAAPAPPAPSEEGVVTITAPMLGVFYAAPSPGAKPFVSVGDSIKKGDVLCIIEAMKLMNEITAEQEGTLFEVCVGNGQVVDFGHPLFRLR